VTTSTIPAMRMNAKAKILWVRILFSG
jgi:hypothetical protein